MDPLAYPIFLFISAKVTSKFDAFTAAAYTNNANLVMGIGAAILTTWFMIKGYKYAHNPRGEPMSEFFFKVGKIAIITGFISAAAGGNMQLQNGVFQVRQAIMESVGCAGAFCSNIGSQRVYSDLSTMNTTLGLATVFASDSKTESHTKSTAMNLSLVGSASPQITAGILLLLNEIGIRIGFFLLPFMLFALIFDMTKDLFFSWLRHMMGAMMYLVLLSATVAIATAITIDFMIAKTAIELAGSIIGESVLSELQESLMQAGFGLMMTALIVTIPSMANRYFGGAIEGQAFNSFSGMRSGGGPSAPPPGSPPNIGGARSSATSPSQGSPAAAPGAPSAGTPVNPGVPPQSAQPQSITPPTRGVAV